MALSAKYCERPAEEETINDPTNPRHYWRFRKAYGATDTQRILHHKECSMKRLHHISSNNSFLKNTSTKSHCLKKSSDFARYVFRCHFYPELDTASHRPFFILLLLLLFVLFSSICIKLNKLYRPFYDEVYACLLHPVCRYRTILRVVGG